MSDGYHAPRAKADFVGIHETAMDRFYRNGVILSDTLKWGRSGRSVVTLIGLVKLRGSLILDVEKTINKWRDGGVEWMQTDQYCYNLYRDGEENSEIFRYDNWHAHGECGHESPFHKHIYKDGKQIKGSPFEYKLEEWPTLGRVILEADEYYCSNIVDLEPILDKMKGK